MQPRSSADGIAVVLLAAGAIAGALLGGPWLWLHYLYKPMTTAMILSLAARAAPVPSVSYRRAVVAGMLLSLAGDIFLMLPQDLFVPGLVAFLLAHLCFIAAFFPGARWPARLVAVGAYAAVAGANLALLLPKVPPPLHVPVLAYVCVLVVMAGFAGARAWALRHDVALAKPARAAALGGALFVLSDSLLAWNKFGGAVSLAPLLVLISYYGALWCIGRSVGRFGAAAASALKKVTEATDWHNPQPTALDRRASLSRRWILSRPKAWTKLAGRRTT